MSKIEDYSKGYKFVSLMDFIKIMMAEDDEADYFILDAEENESIDICDVTLEDVLNDENNDFLFLVKQEDND